MHMPYIRDRTVGTPGPNRDNAGIRVVQTSGVYLQTEDWTHCQARGDVARFSRWGNLQFVQARGRGQQHHTS